MAMIVELTKSPIVQKEGERIFDVIRFELFGEMEKKVVSFDLSPPEFHKWIISTLHLDMSSASGSE